MNDSTGRRFTYSVVMAVYNVGAYLEQSLQSLLTQDIGFSEHVQLILVDDASTDQSGMLCDQYQMRYPDNILVPHHAENSGTSSARNDGLSLARGRYLGFVDPDDTLSRDALRKVLSFFQSHQGLTDVVSIPMRWFGDKSGGHLLNNKFDAGTRLVSLEREPDCIQMSLSSSFICREAIEGSRCLFDKRLSVSEDAKLLHQLLLKKKTIGLVSDCTYHYRRREDGDPSTLQRACGSEAWYSDHLHYYVQDTLSLCKACVGDVPQFVQFAVMYDLQWRMLEAMNGNVPESLDHSEYIATLRQCLQDIGAEVILSQRNLPKCVQLYLLRLKLGGEPTFFYEDGYPIVRVQGETVICDDFSGATLDYATLEPKRLIIQGRVSLPAGGLEPLIQVQWNGAWLDAVRIYPDAKCYQSKEIMGTLVEETVGFCVTLPLSEMRAYGQARIWCRLGGTCFPVSLSRFGPFCPIGTELKQAYYAAGPWLLTCDGTAFFLSKNSWRSRSRRELQLWRELWRRGCGGKAAIALRLAQRVLRCVRKKPIWLLSDRIERGGDNGEAFFKYLRANGCPADLRFLLRKGSADWPRLRKTGVVIPFFSFRHKLCHLLCEFILSSQADHYTTNPFGDEWIYYRDLQCHQRFVFLQHGIIKDDLSAWLNRYYKNIYGFVVSTDRERESVVKGSYDYREEQIWLTGLPRYDLLYHNEKRLITIMPTWRKYLMGNFHTDTASRAIKQEFLSSTYYKFYAALLNDSRLLGTAKQLGYQICFMPHPMLMPYRSLFPQNKEVRFFTAEVQYKDVFAESELILTDYSSVAFDFAYLRKPVLYCRPDHADFISGSHMYTPGYFSYEQDGFGEITLSLEETVEKTIEYMRNGCQLKPLYRERIERFFTFHDTSNCLRLWKHLCEKKKSSV